MFLMLANSHGSSKSRCIFFCFGFPYFISFSNRLLQSAIGSRVGHDVFQHALGTLKGDFVEICARRLRVKLILTNFCYGLFVLTKLAIPFTSRDTWSRAFKNKTNQNWKSSLYCFAFHGGK